MIVGGKEYNCYSRNSLEQFLSYSIVYAMMFVSRITWEVLRVHKSYINTSQNESKIVN